MQSSYLHLISSCTDLYSDPIGNDGVGLTGVVFSAFPCANDFELISSSNFSSSKCSSDFFELSRTELEQVCMISKPTLIRSS